ncbi:MAG: hypothetical protein M1821_008475 [Bathelium mastoideum]|nr:MAG: hypothetical protein M1821_008475 [Bathelium mastoideum]
MADGLSVTASITGLVSLADVVVRRLYKYGSEVRGARKEVNKLIAEVSTFYGLLKSLKLVAEELSNEPRFQTISLPFVHPCQTVLEEIRTKLDRHASTEGRWKWPLSSSETKDLLQDVERQKSTIAAVLAVSNTQIILAALSGLEDLQKGVNSFRKRLEHKLEVDSRIVLNKERKKILDSFSTLVPRTNYETNLKLRQPGTGIWLLESDEFKAWVSTANSGLWLYDIPGAGKSVLAASIVEFAIAESAAGSSENAAVYFFCDYKAPETKVPAVIMASLVRQLARQSWPGFELIESFYKKRTSQGNQWSQPSAEQLADLFVQMSHFFANCMVIVDGVDECGDNQVMTSAKDPAPSKCLSSVAMSMTYAGSATDFQKMPIVARNSDIQLYVTAEIEQRIDNKKLRLKDNTLKEVIVDSLVNGAQGMFHWAACQIDYLCELPTDSSRRKALQTLPPTLFKTYERILHRVNERDIYSQRIVQRALRWTMTSFGFHLSVEALCEAVSIDDDAVRLDPDSIPDKEDILRLCSGLLCETAVGDKASLLRPAHFTVQEFLTQIDPIKQPKFAPYRVDHVVDNIWTQRVALQYLCFEDFSSPPVESINELREKYKKYPLRRSIMTSYKFNQQFLDDPSTDTSFTNQMQVLLDRDRPKTFLSWAQEYGLARRQDVNFYDGVSYRDLSDSDLRETTRRILSAHPLHFAASLGYTHVCSALIANGANPNHLSDIGSPLHCAIIGPDVFQEPHSWLWRNGGILLGHYYSTAKVLLAAGADPNKDWCPEPQGPHERQTRTVPLLCIDQARNLLPDVCRAGARLSSLDAKLLIELLNSPETQFAFNPKAFDPRNLDWLKELIDVIDIESLDDSNRKILAQLAIAYFPQQTTFQLPRSFKQVIASGDVDCVEKILRKQFDGVAKGEFEWLRELKEGGYTYQGLAEFLIEEATFSPWIPFEAKEYAPVEVIPGKHIPMCAHQSTNLGNTSEIPAAIVSNRDLAHCLVQELCGLGGVVPSSSNREEWVGRVDFRESNCTSAVSYPIPTETEQGIYTLLIRLQNTLNSWCIAAAQLQSGGLCCDSFTVLIGSRLGQVTAASGTIKLAKIHFILAMNLQNELAIALKAKFAVLESLGRAASAAEQILKGVSLPIDHSIYEKKLYHLQICALVIQFLCLGLLSYTQAHIGALQPFFLDTAQRQVVLLGC